MPDQQFEQRVQLTQGNGIVTTYTYDAQTRRLHTLTAGRANGTQFQNLAYAYDKVGNILGLKNLAAQPRGQVLHNHITMTSKARLSADLMERAGSSSDR